MIRAARLSEPATLEEWVAVAQRQPSFLAIASDMRKMARAMVRLGFVSIHGGIRQSPDLIALPDRADYETLRRIASLLLSAAPPSWLESSLTQNGLASEYIPTYDWDALRWLGDDLDIILRQISAKVWSERNQLLMDKLGIAGELVVMLSKTATGADPIHVSPISDFFGYDIEAKGPLGIERIEVKATVQRLRGSFFISRNEYEKSLTYGSQWYILQVIFSSTVLFRDEISRADILEANVLTAQALQEVIPRDPEGFRWQESARITAPSDSWIVYRLDLPDDLHITIPSASSD